MTLWTHDTDWISLLISTVTSVYTNRGISSIVQHQLRYWFYFGFNKLLTRDKIPPNKPCPTLSILFISHLISPVTGFTWHMWTVDITWTWPEKLPAHLLFNFQHTDCAKLIESRIKKCHRLYYLKYMEAEDSWFN